MKTLFKLWLPCLLLISTNCFAQTRQLTVGTLTITGSGRLTNPASNGSHSRFDFLGPSGLNNPHSYDIAEYPNTGSDRPNLVGRVGYNTNLAAGDHAFYMTTESYNHPTSNGQLEWYLEYFSPDQMFSTRPIGVTIPVNGDSANYVVVNLNGDRVDFIPPTQNGTLMAFGKNATFYTGLAGTIPSQMDFRSFDSGGNIFSLIDSAPFFYIDGRSLPNGAVTQILNPMGMTGPAFKISTGNTDEFTVDAAGVVNVNSLKTTGAAGGKKVVCVDTTTGQLYASSTGTDCSN